MAEAEDIWGHRKAMVACLVDMLDEDIYTASAIKDDFQSIDDNVPDKLLEYINVFTRYSDLFQSYWGSLYNQQEYELAFQTSNAPAVSSGVAEDADTIGEVFGEAQEDDDWEEDLPEPESFDADEWELREFVRGVSMRKHDQMLGGWFDNAINSVKGIFSDVKKTVSTGDWAGNLVQTINQVIPEGTKGFKDIVSNVVEGCKKEGKALLTQGAGKAISFVHEKITDVASKNPIVSTVWDVANKVWDNSGLGPALKSQFGVVDPPPDHKKKTDVDRAIIGDSAYDMWTYMQCQNIPTTENDTFGRYMVMNKKNVSPLHVEYKILEKKIKGKKYTTPLRKEEEAGFGFKVYYSEDISITNVSEIAMLGCISVEASTNEYKDMEFKRQDRYRMVIDCVDYNFSRAIVDLQGYDIPLLCKIPEGTNDDGTIKWSDWGFFTSFVFQKDNTDSYLCMFIRNPFYGGSSSRGSDEFSLRIMTGRSYPFTIAHGPSDQSESGSLATNMQWNLRYRGEYKRTNRATYDTFYHLDIRNNTTVGYTQFSTSVPMFQIDGPDGVEYQTRVVSYQPKKLDSEIPSGYCKPFLGYFEIVTSESNLGEIPSIKVGTKGDGYYIQVSSSPVKDLAVKDIRHTKEYGMGTFIWKDDTVLIALPTELSQNAKDEPIKISFCAEWEKSMSASGKEKGGYKLPFSHLNSTKEVFLVTDRLCVDKFSICQYGNFFTYNITFKHGDIEESFISYGEHQIVAIGEIPKQCKPYDDIVIPVTQYSWILINTAGEVIFNNYDEGVGDKEPVALGLGMTVSMSYPFFHKNTTTTVTIPGAIALPTVRTRHKRIPSLKHRVAKIRVDYSLYDWKGISISDFAAEFRDGLMLYANYDLSNIRRPLYLGEERVDTPELMEEMIEDVENIRIRVGDGNILKVFNITEVKKEDLTGTFHSGYYTLACRICDFVWAWDNLQWIVNNAETMYEDLKTLLDSWDDIGVMEYFEAINHHKELMAITVSNISGLFSQIKQETVGQ